MRLSIPLTGTVLVEGEVHGAGDLVGDPNDPIRPVDIDLGNVSWAMIDVDLENEVMIIEIEPSLEIDEDTGEETPEGKSIYKRKLATSKEKAGFLLHARELIETHTKDELYQMSKCPRLKKT